MFVRSNTVSVSLSTLGAGAAYSTVFNGAVHSAYVIVSAAAAAGTKVIITSETTTKSILTVANPSTLGAWYYPRKTVHGATGAALGSSTPCYEVLSDERAKVNVTSSSALGSETVTVVLNVV